MLEQAHEVMRAWGITYKTNLVWRKVTPSGKVRMGCGYWARTMHELRRADLFAREKRKGWDCWGDEVEKFSPASSHAERDTILIGGEQPEQPNRGIGAAGRGATTETTDSR